MKILVIGNGFLGKSIIQRLISEGHELLVYSRATNERVQCQQIAGDILDFEDFIKVLLWKPRIIIHTAWITSENYRNDLSNFKYARFTTDLAGYIACSDVEHLIILGSCAEYGHQVGPSTAGFTKLSPASLYAEQKVIAFNSVRELLKRSDVRFTWARIFYPYGPTQDQKRLVPHLINCLRNGEPVVLADTSSILDWITTRDVASAISWVIDNELPIEIDIGTSLGFTNLELLITLEDLLQIPTKLYEHGPHYFGLNDVFVAGANSPLLKSGWLPADTISTGLEWVLSS
jgi:nucleoside-diphosphate-sugar epimerase